MSGPQICCFSLDYWAPAKWILMEEAALFRCTDDEAIKEEQKFWCDYGTRWVTNTPACSSLGQWLPWDLLLNALPNSPWHWTCRTPAWHVCRADLSMMEWRRAKQPEKIKSVWFIPHPNFHYVPDTNKGPPLLHPPYIKAISAGPCFFNYCLRHLNEP